MSNIVSNLQGHDYIVEQGTSGIWTYCKLNSGLAICWGSNTILTQVGGAWGTLYSTGRLSASIIDFPFEFAEIPNETVTITDKSNYSGWLCDAGYGSITKTHTGEYSIIRPTTTGANTPFTLNYLEIGRWK